jgi:phytanoyl-CoA hydroxylase
MLILPETWSANLPWVDRPEADIEAFVRRNSNQYSFELMTALKAWKRDGVVIFENVVPPALLAEFEADLAHLLGNHKDYGIPIEVRGKQTLSRAVTEEQINDPGVKFNHLHTLSSAAARLSLIRPAAEFLRIIFQSTPMPIQSLTFQRGSEQPIHIDYPYVNPQRRLPYLAASWIPLEDIHPDSGPLAYYPGAHRIDVSGFFDWGAGSIIKTETSTNNSTQFAKYLSEQVSRVGIKPAVYCPKRGDLLIWHANLPHGGTPIINRQLTRKSYVTHYTSFEDYPERWHIPPTDLARRSISLNGGLVCEFPWTVSADKLPSWRR